MESGPVLLVRSETIEMTQSVRRAIRHVVVPKWRSLKDPSVLGLVIAARQLLRGIARNALLETHLKPRAAECAKKREVFNVMGQSFLVPCKSVFDLLCYMVSQCGILFR